MVVCFARALAESLLLRPGFGSVSLPARMKKFLLLNFFPASADLGLLVLRLWFAGCLLANHGWGKLSRFSEMAGKFSDPLGVGSSVSLSLAIVGEVVCPILLIFGLWTRVAALGSGITMAVAWSVVHDMRFQNPGSGELAFLFLGAFVVLLIAGPGRFSADRKLGTG